jgi:peptidyl-prolyl cis-trans isomerase SurA
MNKKIQMILLTLCTLFAINSTAHAASDDKIVAIVNKEIITQNQLNQQIRLAKQQAAATQQRLPGDLTKAILNKMIDTSMQLQLAKSMGIVVSDETVDQSIEGIAQRNNLTIAQLQEALKREGIDFTRYRKDMHEQIILSQLHQRVLGGKIKVNDDDVDTQMRAGATIQKNQPPAEYHVADILLTMPENATAQEIAAKRKEAETSLAHLRQGASFEELAVVKSGGPDALKGGDLGWRKLSDLPSLFVPYVKKMQPGQLSEIIQAPNGFHILHLIEMRGNAPAQTQSSSTETEVRHILLRTTVLAKAADLKLRLINIRRDLDHGADFAKLAEQYSQDAQSASKGGNIGWIKTGTMEPGFEQAMASLKPGQTSQPFATSAGWHLVQVLKRRTADNSKNFAREQARQQAYGHKADEAIKVWLKQMRAETYIKIMLPGASN